ncbi:MAG TPA: prolipoprotein diacylglyceryl transferase [Bellilinea sp.]|nr:prolipoprotein diacylglyceryl transferase [Bellilinea sp.]
MITVSIDPIILSIGHFHLRWYSLIVMLAIGIGFWLVIKEAGRKGYTKDAVFDLGVWVVVGGMIGARLFHVIDHWPDVFSKDPGRIFAIWEGGLAIWGGIVGGLITLSIIAWRKHWNLARLLDTFAPGVVLGQAIGRVACIITGDSVGKPTNGPFGLAYTSPDAMVPQLGVFYTPTPIYEILLNSAIFVVLWRLRKKQLPDGALFLVYLTLYSIGRFFITLLSSYREFAFGLNQAQVVSLIGLAVAVPLLVRMVVIQNRVRA